MPLQNNKYKLIISILIFCFIIVIFYFNELYNKYQTLSLINDETNNLNSYIKNNYKDVDIKYYVAFYKNSNKINKSDNFLISKNNIISKLDKKILKLNKSNDMYIYSTDKFYSLFNYDNANDNIKPNIIIKHNLMNRFK